MLWFVFICALFVLLTLMNIYINLVIKRQTIIEVIKLVEFQLIDPINKRNASYIKDSNDIFNKYVDDSNKTFKNYIKNTNEIFNIYNKKIRRLENMFVNLGHEELLTKLYQKDRLAEENKNKSETKPKTKAPVKLTIVKSEE